jgi:hypothetical protein
LLDDYSRAGRFGDVRCNGVGIPRIATGRR